MSRRARRWLLVLVVLHLGVAVGGFLAPYHYATQHRDRPWAPPTRIRLVDAEGEFRWRPFLYTQRPTATPSRYVEDRSRAYPIRFFARGEPYRLLGFLPWDRHLLGVEAPARLFLLGSDGLGRDQFSRLLYGGQISLAAGLLAAGVALLIGVVVGAAAGYRGGVVDALGMRIAELFMALPWLYLLLGVRAFLPLDLQAGAVFVALIVLVGGLGWPRPARLVRGVVASAREHEYVLAARGLGIPERRLLLRHALPAAGGVIRTQAALLVPRFVLAEVTLSFLGLGLGEPLPSWGSLLAELQRYDVLISYWWMATPAAALFAVAFAYQQLGESLSGDTVSQL